jgi:cytochrome c-type biogenesis protein CcmE
VDLNDSDMNLGADVSDGGDELDLTPRAVSTTSRKKRRLGAPLLLAFLLVVGGFIVFQFLTSATVFFCEANKAGVSKDCAAGKRFRLLGNVDNGSVKKGNPLRFNVSWLGATVPVTYQGDPGGIFCEGQSVAVEGRYDGTEFSGDRILVKHDAVYSPADPDRSRGCGDA